MDNQVINSNGGTLSPREQGISEFVQMDNYFKSADAKYLQADEVMNEIKMLEEGVSSGRVIGAVIFIALGLFWGYIVGMDFPWGFPDVFVVIALLGFNFGLAYLLLRKQSKLKKENEAKLEKARQSYQAIDNELLVNYNNYPGLCPIGAEYTHPNTRAAIGNMIRQGRASNCAEAINLILDDIHKANMELMAANTQHAAQDAASNSGVAAAASIASLLFK